MLQTRVDSRTPGAWLLERLIAGWFGSSPAGDCTSPTSAMLRGPCSSIFILANGTKTFLGSCKSQLLCCPWCVVRAKFIARSQRPWDWARLQSQELRAISRLHFLDSDASLPA